MLFKNSVIFMNRGRLYGNASGIESQNTKSTVIFGIFTLLSRSIFVVLSSDESRVIHFGILEKFCWGGVRQGVCRWDESVEAVVVEVIRVEPVPGLIVEWSAGI